MKKLLFVLSLVLSTTSFAGVLGPDVVCTGVDSDKANITIEVFVDYSSYCSDAQNLEFEAALILTTDSDPMKTVMNGKVTSKTGSQVIIIEQPGFTPAIAKLSVQYDVQNGGVTAKYSTIIEMDERTMSPVYGDVELKCELPVQVNMDC